MPERRVVLLTGATGLVGAELVRGFVGAGDRVVGVARDLARLEALRASLGDRFEPLAADLGEPGAASALAAHFGPGGPDVLVHAARDAAQLGLGDGQVTREQWLANYALEVVAPYELITALAGLPGSKLRAVVLVGSMYGIVAPTPALYDDFATESVPHYGTGKAALVHLAKELAVRLAPRVRVNAVSYGGVAGRADPAFRARYAGLTPLGRMLEQHDLPGPALFLASDAASGVTGHNLVVDGGWSLSLTRRTLAVIPARGGSQRILRKNITPLAGKPLLAWTVEAALGSGAIDRLIVSTDDAEIAEVARALGADVPWLRDELADHQAGADAVTAALVGRLADGGERYDDVVQLLPTCPLRTAGHVRDAVAQFRASGARAQASCFRFGWDNPWWALELDGAGAGRFVFPQALETRSQDLAPLHGLTGAVWVATADAWLECGGFPLAACTWFELPWQAAIDIDEPDDLELAGALLQLRESA